MLDQITFDRSEDISEALHEQEGLSMALLSYLDGKLSPHDEQVFHALLMAQSSCRKRAMEIARNIATSGGSSG
jgi:anti-sigma factor RsiW